MSVSLAQCGVAADLERDVREPDLSAVRARRVVGRGMLADIECVEVLTQGHKDAAMLGVFLGDLEPKHVAVEPLGGLLGRRPSD